jgi:hypothetical protein
MAEINLMALVVNIIVNVIVLSPVLWIAGRLLVGKDKAKFTDALWIVVLGTVIGAVGEAFFRYRMVKGPCDSDSSDNNLHSNCCNIGANRTSHNSRQLTFHLVRKRKIFPFFSLFERCIALLNGQI